MLPTVGRYSEDTFHVAANSMQEALVGVAAVPHYGGHHEDKDTLEHMDVR